MRFDQRSQDEILEEVKLHFGEREHSGMTESPAKLTMVMAFDPE